MSYRPRMKSSVRSIVPVHDVNYLQFEHMVIDHWQVEAKSGATGEYISPDPRFVVFFDGATVALEHGGAESGTVCGACYIPAGLPVCSKILTAGYLEHIDIHIEQEQLFRIVGKSADMQSAAFLSASIELQQLSGLLADECRKSRRPAGYGEALASGVIHEIFHLNAQSRRHDAAPAWFDDVLDHVMESLDRRLSIEELAAVAGMSRSQFSKCFRETAGQPPHQWVMETRIQHAQRLLSDGAHLSQVAHDTGFADQAHFSRCFRRSTGLPPGQWCKRYNSSKSRAIVQDSLSLQN
ncbi:MULTISPECIES: helix-turn-helix domain-containing protein [Nisaea]|uniref:helix-turn-helix domain-containing protein n=1 Tax=Nisaea TaxID=390876 RepID=UPI0004185A4A|nr:MULTISPECIES: AraC family transcriptional regulator [Nisaea]